jgi:hypothetical protein
VPGNTRGGELHHLGDSGNLPDRATETYRLSAKGEEGNPFGDGKGEMAAIACDRDV